MTAPGIIKDYIIINVVLLWIKKFFWVKLLTLFRKGLLGAAHRQGETTHSLKSVTHIHDDVIWLLPLIQRSKKYVNHVTHLLSSADISIFSPEISNICHIKKYRYRLHFLRIISNSFNLFFGGGVFTGCFDKNGCNFDASKIGYSRPL